MDVDGLDRAERLLDLGKRLVGADGCGIAENPFGQIGAQDVEAVKRSRPKPRRRRSQSYSVPVMIRSNLVLSQASRGRAVTRPASSFSPWRCQAAGTPA